MVSPSMLKPVVTVFVLILSSCSAEDLAEQLLTDFDQWVGPKLGINVTDKENFVEDVWIRDVVWEAMVTTAWKDYISRLNRLGYFRMFDNQEFRDKALYGVTIEPLELALLTGQETLSLERSILGYQVLLL